MPLVQNSSAFGGYIQNYAFTPDEVTLDAPLFLEECRPELRRLIADMVSHMLWHGWRSGTKLNQADPEPKKIKILCFLNLFDIFLSFFKYFFLVTICSELQFFYSVQLFFDFDTILRFAFISDIK